jgi:hypothetical protein
MVGSELCLNTVTWPVVGSVPSFATSSPRRALRKALLPELYSPTTTSRKGSPMSESVRRKSSTSPDGAPNPVRNSIRLSIRARSLVTSVS